MRIQLLNHPLIFFTFLAIIFFFFSELEVEAADLERGGPDSIDSLTGAISFSSVASDFEFITLLGVGSFNLTFVFE